MEINLHIGAHRTASTTLQTFLNTNQTALHDTGIEVWTPLRTRKGLFAGLIEQPEDITEAIARRAARSCGLIGIEVALLARAGRRQLLISDENMIGTTRNNLRQRRLYPRLDERLLRFGPTLGPRLRRIGLSIRSYDTYWASCMAFGIAQGFRMPMTADLDHYITQPRRWRDVIRDVATAFPGAEILVWPYERFAGQPDAQLAFLTGGVKPAAGVTGARDWINPSPRCDQLRMILNQRGDTSPGRNLTDQTGRWMPFDEAQRIAMRAQYAVDLDWLRSGADGLARLVEQTAPPATYDKTITITKPYDIEDSDRIPAGQPPPDVLTGKGRQFGTQDIMV